MSDTERDPFDEFDDLDADDTDEGDIEVPLTKEGISGIDGKIEEAEERDLRAAIEGEEASAEPEPVSVEPEPVASNSPYPTEEPDDPSVLWSPRPGIVGCKLRGYKKIK